MKKIEFQIDSIQPIGANVVHIKLVPRNPAQRIFYRPGQYGLISFFNGDSVSKERPFSFLSSPLEDGTLEFGFKVFGEFTSQFADLKKGDRVFVRGPFGSFTFDENKYSDTLFLSAGIGITPFVSIFRYASAKKLPNKLRLLYSNKASKETPFYAELKALEATNPNLKTDFYVTSKDEIAPQGFTAGRINQEEITKAISGDISGKTFFICGPQLFHDSMVDILRAMGVKERNIKTEGFTLSPRSFFERGTWAFPMVAGASAVVILASLYAVYDYETEKQLAYQETQALTQMQIEEMTSMNEEIIENKNALLTEQKANTRTIYTTTTQTTPSVIEPTTPPVTTPTTPPATPPVTVPPRTTVS
ncbi:MAG: FAD-dependent oxidoreductase [Candidatus Gracilibacteria bacterium]|jgi:ferredoxin-NADP reductase